MIDWSNYEHRAALLRLGHYGRLARSRAIDDLVNTMLADGWVIQSPRSREVALVEYGNMLLLRILEARWPTWRETARDLAARAIPISARALIEHAKRAEYHANGEVALPRVLNRKTYSALSKTDSKRLAVGTVHQGCGVVLTKDSGLQIRTHDGARLRVEELELDCDAQMAMMEMVHLSERMLLRDWALAGVPPRLVLSVENPASLHDLTLVPGVLALLVDGWNTPLAIEFLRHVPSAIPHAYFGDYDATGLRIYRHLRDALGRDIAQLAPSFALEYLPTHGRPVSRKCTPWSQVPAESGEPELLRCLRQSNQWLEQESITLDGRLVEALELLTGNITPAD